MKLDPKPKTAGTELRKRGKTQQEVRYRQQINCIISQHDNHVGNRPLGECSVNSGETSNMLETRLASQNQKHNLEFGVNKPLNI